MVGVYSLLKFELDHRSERTGLVQFDFVPFRLWLYHSLGDPGVDGTVSSISDLRISQVPSDDELT